MGFKLVVDVESAATSTAAPEPVPVPEVEEDDIDGLSTIAVSMEYHLVNGLFC